MILALLDKNLIGPICRKYFGACWRGLRILIHVWPWEWDDLIGRFFFVVEWCVFTYLLLLGSFFPGLDPRNNIVFMATRFSFGLFNFEYGIREIIKSLYLKFKFVTQMKSLLFICFFLLCSLDYPTKCYYSNSFKHMEKVPN